MAQRRMFNKKITETDLFLDMPMSAQCLYFHLNMSADDDGFIGNVKTVKRMIGASDDDLKILMAKEFIIPFESGVVVIKDWKIHNYIRSDRYAETVYLEEKRQLSVSDNGRYALGVPDVIPNVIPNVIPTVDGWDTQDRLCKDRLGKYKKEILSGDAAQPIPYSPIIDYLNEQTGKKFKASSAANKKLIKARWNEGYREEDFFKVIDNKVVDWKGKKFSDGTDADKYLQPSTLFGNKFDSYLNQTTKQQGGKGESYGGLVF